MEMNDKNIREKLSNYQAPFDPTAWNKMEQMLNQKKKRRFLVWWWLGGTSLAAVLAAMSLFVLAPKQETSSSALNLAKNNQVNENINAASPRIETIEDAGGVSNSNGEDERLSYPTTNGWQKLVVKNEEATTSNLPKKNNRSLNQKQKQSLAPLAKNTNNSSRDKKSGIQNTLLPQTPNVEIVTQISFLKAAAIATISEQAEILQASKNEAVNLPIKKKKYCYELGFNSGTFAVLTNNKLAANPSFFLGVVEAHRFGKYMALTNGLYYSQTSFRQQFSPVDSMRDLRSFSTKFHAVSLAVGVNVYPISTRKIDWYVGLGVFNNFKVKETIAYELDLQKSQEDVLINYSPIAGLNTGNSRNTTTENELQKGYGTKFYTANFYTSTGFEAQLYKGLRLNAGVQYQLGLFKTIDKQSLPHFVGGELGLRYRF